MKIATKISAVLIAVLMTCALLTGCGSSQLGDDGYVTLSAAKKLASAAVKEYLQNSISVSGDYRFYASDRGYAFPQYTDDENAMVISYNTEGSQMMVDGVEYTDDDIVVLVAGDASSATVVKAPDMESDEPTGTLFDKSVVYGYWIYDSDTVDAYYAFYDEADGSLWISYTRDGVERSRGVYEYANNTITMKDMNGGLVLNVTVTDYDKLTDSDGDTLSQYNPGE